MHQRGFAADPRLSTLYGAIEAASLDETLATGGPYTIFAPTNDAFDALPNLLAKTLQLEKLGLEVARHQSLQAPCWSHLVGLELQKNQHEFFTKPIWRKLGHIILGRGHGQKLFHPIWAKLGVIAFDTLPFPRLEGTPSPGIPGGALQTTGPNE